MRDSRIVPVVLLTWLALAEGFLAWPNPAGKITESEEDLARYFSPIFPEPSSTSRETCLYLSPDLPDCRFDRSAESVDEDVSPAENYRSLHKHSVDTAKRRRSKSLVNERDGISENRLKGTKRETLLVVYTIEGCLPSRLPFDMPLCRDEDFVDKIMDIRKLYPFRVKASSFEETFVFPKFNLGQWLKMARRFRQRSIPSIVERKAVVEGTEETRLSGQRESELIRATKRKTTIPRATKPSTYASKGSPSSSVIIHDEPVTNDREVKSNFNPEPYPMGDDETTDVGRLVLLEFKPLDNAATRESFYRAIIDNQGQWKTSESTGRGTDRRSTRWFDRFSNHLHPQSPPELPINSFRSISRLGRNRREIIREGSEFPYAKAIPFDPEKLGTVYAQHPRQSRESFLQELPAAFVGAENLRARRTLGQNSRVVDSKRGMDFATTRKNSKKHGKKNSGKRSKETKPTYRSQQ